MSTAKKIEKTLQDALIALLDADAYIIANDLPVRAWYETGENLAEYQVLVHSNPATPSLATESGEAAEWRVQIDLVAYTYTTSTETQGASTVYEYLFGFALALTSAAIASASGLTITGKWMVDNAEAFDERFRGKVASFEVYAS